MLFLWKQWSFGKAAGGAWVTLSSLRSRIVDYLRRDHYRSRGIEHGDLVRNRSYMTVLKRDEPARFDAHLLARGHFPDDVTFERSRLHVQHPVKAVEPRRGQVKGLIVHIQP